MSIPFAKYVRIVSGVAGGAGVRQRDLIARLFTTSQFVSPDAVLEFSNAADVATFFGDTSEEYARAALYFGWVSPNTTAARAISFARYAAMAVDTSVIGNNDAKVLTSLQAVTAGAFSITLGAGPARNVGPLTFAASANLAAIATALQTAVRAADASLITATVTYGTVSPQRFVIAIPGATSTIKITDGAQTPAALLGLLTSVGAINITGSAVQTPVEAFNSSQAISDNFGSLVFMAPLSLPAAEAVAAAVAAENVKYMYSLSPTVSNAAAWYAALKGYASTGLTLAALSGEYPDMMMPTILAATDYSKRNSVMGYMFRQFAGITATVMDAATSDAMDAIRVNYYGQTATAGQKIEFFQRGTLMGTGTAPVDMNVHANEQWLKDYAGSQIMSLLLSVGRVPANDSGRAMVLNILQPVVDQALFNGVISIGKLLTPVQRIFVSQATGDSLAWITVQNAGYVLSCTIEPYVTVSGATEYRAVYVLIYSKDDTIRRVDGTHSLI